MPYYNVKPPVTIDSHPGGILEYLGSEPDNGFRIDTEGLIDRVDILEADAAAFAAVFEEHPLLEETEEEL